MTIPTLAQVRAAVSPRVLLGVALLVLVAGVTGAIAFHSGKQAGRLEAPALERKRQLEQLRKDLELRDRAIRNRDARIAAQRDTIDATRAAAAAALAEYSPARARVEIVDSSSAKIDGILAQLPPPVIHVLQAGDALHRADSAQVAQLELYAVSLEEWGNLWKDQAEDYRIRGEILEQQLVDERRGRLHTRIRDAGIGAAVGALLTAIAR